MVPETPQDLIAAVNAAAARTAWPRLNLRWLASVTSTMEVAADAVSDGAPEGTVIVADQQSQGRGRRGRAWSSPPGAGLYFSLVLRPPLDASGSLSVLTLAAGVATRAAIAAASGLAPELKWPNDIVVGRRKLAGILAEGFALGSADQAVVIGIGVNILAAAHPHDVASRATSLDAELGRAVDRARLLEELIVAIAAVYRRLCEGRAGDILREWCAAAPSATGATVEWRVNDGIRRGVSAGIDEDGALLVRTAAGVERVVAGEVIWR